MKGFKIPNLLYRRRQLAREETNEQAANAAAGEDFLLCYLQRQPWRLLRGISVLAQLRGFTLHQQKQF